MMPSFQEVMTAAADDGTETVATSFWDSVGIGWQAGMYGGYVLAGGIRFQVDDGAGGPASQTTIVSATLTFDVIDFLLNPVATIFADAVDSAAAWDSASRPTQIVQTTASAVMTPAALGLLVVSVTPIVQEIISRPGWTPGNFMRFAILHSGPDGAFFEVDAIDDAAGEETTLDIDYTSEDIPVPIIPPQYSSRFALRQRS